MKTYGSSTEDYLRNIPYKTDTDKILKEIAQNLAYIADELADSNRINKDSIRCMVDELSECGVEAPKEEPKSELLELGIDNGPTECFICGKELDLKRVSGLIMDSYGNSYCACERCLHKFDALVGHLLMPNEIYF
jgi:hypothetical protein